MPRLRSGRPPVATLISVNMDPVIGRARIEVALHSPDLDPAAFAATIGRQARSLLGPEAGNLRVDVYRCAADRLDGPMTLLATHLEPVGNGYLAPAKREEPATPSSRELPLLGALALWMRSIPGPLGGTHA